MSILGHSLKNNLKMMCKCTRVYELNYIWPHVELKIRLKCIYFYHLLLFSKIKQIFKSKNKSKNQILHMSETPSTLARGQCCIKTAQSFFLSTGP